MVPSTHPNWRLLPFGKSCSCALEPYVTLNKRILSESFLKNYLLKSSRNNCA